MGSDGHNRRKHILTIKKWTEFNLAKVLLSDEQAVENT
jgi:hypothetical protein